MYDRYEQEPQPGIDCVCLTLNAEPHLKETLDTWYKEAPIRRLLVIDGDSKDQTRVILVKYPRVTILIKPGMTTGKAFEVLKNQVKTPYFIWIDVGKIPANGWYETMLKHTNEGDILGSIRVNYKDGRYWNDPIILDPTKRFLGGPLFIRTDILRTYHVDDDYTQRCFDIVMRKQMEEIGGHYSLVSSTSHKCYLPTPVTDKEELTKRHDMNARGIVKYITPEYAREHAGYLLDDHWMLMMNRLPRKWIQETNPSWIPVLEHWRIRRLVIAKAERLLYNNYKKIGAWFNEKGKGIINKDIVDYNPDPKYDVVLSCSTLEHVGFDEKTKDPDGFLNAVNNIRENVLKDGGVLLFSVPVGYNPGVDKVLDSGLVVFDSAAHFSIDGWHIIIGVIKK